MELECLIKASAFVIPMNCISWLITPIHSADTLNQPCPEERVGWPDRVRQNALPRQGGASVPSDQAAIRLSEDPAAGYDLAEAQSERGGATRSDAR
jgi:hypothetical protein